MKCWSTFSAFTVIGLVALPSTVIAQPHCEPLVVNDTAKDPNNNANALSSADEPPPASPIEAEADTVALNNDIATFTGSVEMSQDNLSLRADTANYNKRTQDVDLQGNIRIDNGDTQLLGNTASMNLNDERITIGEARYLIRSQQTRGEARQIRVDENKLTTIDSGSYTRCPNDSNTWQVYARKIVLDPASGQGKAKHARLKLFDVPVAYLPYAQFPIGDQRQSGLLFPRFSSDNSGFDITLPYYFNIAPNVDAILTPRYKEKHGYITEGQFRWLNHFDEWSIDGSYIDNDKTLNEQARWAISVTEKGTLGEKIHTRVRYTDISDPDYLRDINTASFAINRSSYLTRSATVNYQSLNWDAGLLAQDFKAIDRNESAADDFYEQLPEAWIRYRSTPALFRPAVDLDLQHTAFRNETATDGSRATGDFTLSLPLRWSGLHAEPRLGYQRWHYQFERDGSAGAGQSGQGQTRQLDIATPYAELELWSHFVQRNSATVNTLTPRLLYQHQTISRGQPDSSLVPFIDSSETTFNRYQLLSRSRFSGNDVAEEFEQLAVLFEQSRYNPGRDSELTLAIGQKWYLQNQVGSGGFQPDSEQSALLGEAQYRRGPSRASMHIQWDSDDNDIEQAYANLGWRSKKQARRQLVNLGYSYRQSPLLTEANNTIEQAYVSAVSYLGPRWGLFGQYQFDLNNHRHTESLAGIEYDSCCVKLRLVYRDGLNYDPLNTEADNYDRNLMLQIELKGLINFGQSVDSILQQAIDGFTTR